MIGFPELVCRGNPERRIALKTGGFSIWECLLGVHYTTLFLAVLFAVSCDAPPAPPAPAALRQRQTADSGSAP